jgi:hypothetical protein
VPVLTLLAQTNAAPDLTGWLTGSAVTVLAFIVIAFIRGWIVPGVTHTRALAKQDEQSAEIRSLHAMIMDKVVPTLTRATDLMARAAERERST